MFVVLTDQRQVPYIIKRTDKYNNEGVIEFKKVKVLMKKDLFRTGW